MMGIDSGVTRKERPASVSGDTRQLFLDLDGSPPTAASPTGTSASRRAGVTGRRRGAAAVFDPEAAARQLEAHDDYRVLRRLQPRAVAPLRPLAPGERITVIVDTETTGLDHRHDEVIELGMVAFVHDAEGAVVDVIGTFSALQEPTKPIGPEITRLTGITDAMVEGQRIDIDAVEAFIESADLVIAHNAGFDRPSASAWRAASTRSPGAARSERWTGRCTATRARSSATSWGSRGGFIRGTGRSTTATPCSRCSP